MQSFLTLGRFHIPVYGLFAAAGLICAMVLGQFTAPRRNLDRDAIWDAGMFTVFTAFILTRALLVLENLRTFLAYPVLVLELPSLTKGGILVTAVVAVFYLRRRRLPLLSVLDVAAPCTALLCASLSLGTFAEGTRQGMPTTLPWSVPSSFGRVHPAEIYSAIAWLLLCGGLLWVLRTTQRPGETAAWALVLAGLVVFFTDFVQLPGTLYGSTWIQGSQVHGLELIAAGGGLLAWRIGIGAPAPISAKGVGDAV